MCFFVKLLKIKASIRASAPLRHCISNSENPKILIILIQTILHFIVRGLPRPRPAIAVLVLAMTRTLLFAFHSHLNS
jgi:hypothetical protein